MHVSLTYIPGLLTAHGVCGEKRSFLLPASLPRARITPRRIRAQSRRPTLTRDLNTSAPRDMANLRWPALETRRLWIVLGRTQEGEEEVPQPLPKAREAGLRTRGKAGGLGRSGAGGGETTSV